MVGSTAKVTTISIIQMKIHIRKILVEVESLGARKKETNLDSEMFITFI